MFGREMLRYLPTVILFGAIAAALVTCCAPDATWVSQNIDCFDFLYSATTLSVLHAPGAPLYAMLGWLATRLPGNDAWNLAFFLSALPALITCGLIFFIVSRKVASKIAPYIATIAFAGSQVAFSQSIIPEIYSLQCMLLVLTYVLFETRRTKLALLSLGFALCISWGTLMVLPIFVWRYWRNLRELRLMSMLPYLIVPLLLYLYIPIANRPPHLSMGPTGTHELFGYFTYHPSTLLNLAAWEFPQRVGESLLLITASLGVCSILAFLALKRSEHRTLLLLCIPGAAFYLTTRGSDAFVQLVPAFAFASIAVGLMVARYSRVLIVIAFTCSAFLLAGNVYLYDIGRTLDPSPTAARQVLMQLDEVPDGSWIIAAHDPSYAGVYYYNEQSERELRVIHPIFTDLDNVQYWELDRAGSLVLVEIPFDIVPDVGLISEWSMSAAKTIAELNPSEEIWLVTYAGSRNRLGAAVVSSASSAPTVELDSAIKWWEIATVYPYAYKYISGGYMMHTSWRSGTSTNMTVGLFGILLAFGGILGWYLPKKVFAKLPARRRSVITMMCTAILALLLCYVLSITGIPGFRF